MLRYFISTNESEFIEGESVKFENSNVQAIVNTIDVPSRNVSLILISIQVKNQLYLIMDLSQEKMELMRHLKN